MKKKPGAFKAFLPADYAATLKAFIPRHWFVYLVGIGFSLLLYINLDHGPQGDDSGHYFLFWLFGLGYTGYGVGFLGADLMNKPVFFCMAKQQLVIRKVILILGCLISLFFFLVAVKSPYSHWAGETALGEWLLVPIGLAFYGVLVYLAIRNNTLASWVLMVIVFASVWVTKVYFHGSGPDITRPPSITFPLLAISSGLMLPWLWSALGQARFRRGLIGTETLSNQLAHENYGLESFCSFQRQLGHGNAKPTEVGRGTWLLQQLEKASPASNQRLIWEFLYQLRSSKDPLSFLVVWAIFLFLALFLAAHVTSQFNPVILCYLVTVLAMFQGGVIFKRAASPMLPWGRNRLFADNLLNAAARMGFLIVAFGLLYGCARGALHFWPAMNVAPEIRTILEMPMTGYAYCLCVAPFLLFLFHRSRKPSWLLFALAVTWLFGAPPLYEAFAECSILPMVFFFVISWLPFLALCFRRNFKQDLI